MKINTKKAIEILDKAEKSNANLWAYLIAIELIRSYDEYSQSSMEKYFKDCGVENQKHLMWIIWTENKELKKMINNKNIPPKKTIPIDPIYARKIFENEMMMVIPAKYLEICEYILYLMENEYS